MKKRFTSLFPTAAVAAFHTRFIWLGCLFIWSVAASAQTTTRFVSTTGTNSDPYTANSWATATSDLQGAINSLSAGGEVWVAGGTYKPTTGTDREIYFRMRDNVAIYGGFVGTEANRSERPALNLTTPSSTTLSGDIGTAGDPADNSYHVIYNVSLTNTAILDGFVITGGNADNSSDFKANGGGMLNLGASPGLTNCHFTSNTATYGGGLYNHASSNPILTNCSFTSNTATDGGGMINSVSNPILTNCSFMLNTATDGGGVYNYSASSPSLTNCSFTSNTAGDFGGGMFNVNSSPSLTSCRFTSNTAGSFGGGMVSQSSSFSLTNCSFTSNTASYGGGIETNNSSSSLINCSFTSNTAINSNAGGFFNSNFSNTNLINCIFWNNGGSNSIYVDATSATTASYSLFEPSVTNYTGSNNLTTTTSPFVSAVMS